MLEKTPANNETIKVANNQAKPNNDYYATMLVSAKMVAGVGLGLIVVLGAGPLIGLILAEKVLVPTLLAKLAGGLAGGGLGLVKGLNDKRRMH